MKRIILVVMDSLGVGALPDAERYGDAGADTLGHIAAHMPEFHIPNLRAMGLGSIDGVKAVSAAETPAGAFGRFAEASSGKDTITGHWEIAGLLTTTPFRTFEHFPDNFMREYEKAIGRGTLGNYAASGTEIIKELGKEHQKTGKPIVYTSADSVFQIAANVDVIPLEELYHFCETAREMLTGDLQVGRVIARPFVVKNGEYIRTADRRDYAVSPAGKTLLDHVHDAGQTVYAVGKIRDIFNGQGVSASVHTENNMEGVDKTIEAIREEFGGLIFTNLVDFDSKYGHRRDPSGYGKAIEELDARLPELTAAMGSEDILILCADHGNDPTHSGWDHTREYIPALIYGRPVRAGVDLGTRSTFADIGASAAEYLGVAPTAAGVSFLEQISRKTCCTSRG